MEISEKVLYLRNIEAIFEGFAYYCIHNFIYDWPKANWVDRRFFSSFDFYVFFKADKDCTIRVFRIPLRFLFYFCFAQINHGLWSEIFVGTIKVHNNQSTIVFFYYFLKFITLTIKVKSQVFMLAAVRKAPLICLFCCIVQKMSRQLDGTTVQ